MRRRGFIGVGFLLLLSLQLRAFAAGDAPDARDLYLERAGPSLRVHWRPPADHAPVTPTELRLQTTRDLQRWQNLGQKVRWRGGSDFTGITFEASVDADHGFFRLLVRQDAGFIGLEPAEVLGFEGTFLDELSVLQDLTPDEFRRRHTPSRPYLERISFDPTAARFWPEYTNTTFAGGWPLPPGYNLTLTDRELACFRTNGFLVSERLGAPDFGTIYHRIFVRDLPVFVTSDSILHAWHRSYDAMLADVERGFLRPALSRLLQSLAEEIPNAAKDYTSRALLPSLLDADYYLSTARSLLAGNPVASHLGQESRVQDTLEAIAAGQYQEFRLFDQTNYVDFSQFKPRGHYIRYHLENYFRAMMWCGRVDLRVAGIPAVSTRELGTAMVLRDLCQRSGQMPLWKAMDQTLEVFVGVSDSMNFEQLGELQVAAGLTNINAIGRDELTGFRARIEDGTVGIQHIQGHPLVHDYEGQAKLPYSFTTFGQRFVLDAWAMGQVLFNRIVVPGSQPPELVRRRRSYSLDVAFSVFANDGAVPDLLANMANPLGVPFRDGYFYHHNLAAVRATVDQLPATAWDTSIYFLWLSALRSLSLPTTTESYPEAMRTRAWAMKSLNTQMASWTQLRHDTILYAKQTEIGPILCEYPAGFVEPRPEFLNRMQRMADRAATLLGTLPIEAPEFTPVEPYFSAAGMRNAFVTFLSRFAATCGTLRDMAEKELHQQPFNDSENALVDNWVETLLQYSGELEFTGIYPQLFFRGTEGKLPLEAAPPTVSVIPPPHDCNQADELVADVLTAGFSDPDGDPGGVLHEGVGAVNLLIIAVDNGPDRMVYAGPVFSFYEFEKPLGVRMTDEEWKAVVNSPGRPTPPPWTAEYLMPSE